MEKAYKGMMGGYTVWKEGDEKHEATHVVLTKEDYDKLVRTKNSYKQKYEDLKDTTISIEKHNEQITKANNEIKKAENLVNEIKEKAAERVRIAEQKQAEAEALNVNLKRICKENANAKRGLKPKKKHSGFVVVRTQEARDRIPVKKGYQDLRVYKTTVETPYSIHLAISDVEPSAWDDGLNALFGSAWQDHDSNNLAEALNEKNIEKNFIYRQDWQTGKNDLWEIVCWHTKPITMKKEA